VMALGETYILDLSIRNPLPTGGICNCACSLSLFCASLISQPWMQDKSHCPAVECECGKRYWSYSKKAAFDSKLTKGAHP
jgi:hypothetical protein